MSKITLTVFALLLLLFLGNSTGNYAAQPKQKNSDPPTGTFQRMIAENGSVTMDLDLNRLNGINSVGGRPTTLHFATAANSFFPILVFNDQLRGPEPGSMALVAEAQPVPQLPAVLAASSNSSLSKNFRQTRRSIWLCATPRLDSRFLRSKDTSMIINPARSLSITGGRLVVSTEFAESLAAGCWCGCGKFPSARRCNPSRSYVDENGDVKSARLPAMNHLAWGLSPARRHHRRADRLGTIDGGAVNGRVGSLWEPMPATRDDRRGLVCLAEHDHPFIPQNLYRMSGGTDNTQRFEQLGQSWGKHAFTAASSNTCGFGCNGVGGEHLGSGCSDAYGAGLNVQPNRHRFARLGQSIHRIFPQVNVNNHTGHSHDATSHRMLVDTSDLIPAQNPAPSILPKRSTSSRTNTPGAKVIRASATCTLCFYQRHNVVAALQPSV
jgi:hypothetical protein